MGQTAPHAYMHPNMAAVKVVTTDRFDNCSSFDSFFLVAFAYAFLPSSQKKDSRRRSMQVWKVLQYLWAAVKSEREKRKTLRKAFSLVAECLWPMTCRLEGLAVVVSCGLRLCWLVWWIFGEYVDQKLPVKVVTLNVHNKSTTCIVSAPVWHWNRKCHLQQTKSTRRWLEREKSWAHECNCATLCRLANESRRARKIPVPCSGDRLNLPISEISQSRSPH